MIGSEPIRSENHQHFEIAHLLDGPSAEGKAITLLQLIATDHQPGIALADTAEGLLLRSGDSLDTTPHDDRVDEAKQTEMAFHGKYKAKTHATRCNPAPYHTVIRLKFIEAVSKVQANTSDGVAIGQSDAVIKATANARH
jgi:hypothetical protein